MIKLHTDLPRTNVNINDTKSRANAANNQRHCNGHGKKRRRRTISDGAVQYFHDLFSSAQIIIVSYWLSVLLLRWLVTHQSVMKYLEDVTNVALIIGLLLLVLSVPSLSHKHACTHKIKQHLKLQSNFSS